MRINPAPIMMGMTICINIAATLTPFGSSQNILIAYEFNLTSLWFLLSLGLYFVIATFITLFLLDHFILKKHLGDIWCIHSQEFMEPMNEEHFERHELTIMGGHIENKTFNKNMIILVIFIVLLFIIPSILFVALLAALLFIMLNPRETEDGHKRPDISHYLAKVDYKLVFFFICLFLLVFCMEVNGTILLLEELVVNATPDNLFLTCLFILIITSVLSGLLDNVPVTILFIPIIRALILSAGFQATPLLVAFILGINLGGNFLPQGSAVDMMTLEFAKKNKIVDLSYKRLLKVGGTFALLHIVLGIAYLAFIIYFLTPLL